MWLEYTYKLILIIICPIKTIKHSQAILDVRNYPLMTLAKARKLKMK